MRCGVFFWLKADMEKALSEFIENLMNSEADEKKLPVMMGLIEEAFDCKQEIDDLKAQIKTLKEKGARFYAISKRERLLIQKRANYTNMIGRICREVKKHDEKENPADYLDDLGEYE